MKYYNFTVMLIKQGTGVVAFETVAPDHVKAVTQAMDTAFSMFPEAKFGLFGYKQTDGDTTITTTRYLGRV